MGGFRNFNSLAMQSQESCNLLIARKGICHRSREAYGGRMMQLLGICLRPLGIELGQLPIGNFRWDAVHQASNIKLFLPVDAVSVAFQVANAHAGAKQIGASRFTRSNFDSINVSAAKFGNLRCAHISSSRT